MKLVQQHIINKVLLDIDTNRMQTAYEIKDHLDVFLKDELFPHLERYFETIEDDLPAAIIQIPKVSINLTMKKQSDLKKGYLQIQEKLVAQIGDLLTATPSSDTVLHIDISESKWRGLHYFLSHGITPWWEGSKNSFTYTSKDIAEIIKSSVFSSQFRSLIQQKVVRQRLICQGADYDLKMMLSAAFPSNKAETLINTPFIKVMKSVHPETKIHIWHNLIGYLQSQDEQALISYLHQQLVQVKKEDKKPSDYAFAKAALHIIKQLLQINSSVVVPLILQKHQNQNIKEGNLATTLLAISHSLNLVSESQFLKSTMEQSRNKTAAKEEEKKGDTTFYIPENEQIISKDVDKKDSTEVRTVIKQPEDETGKNDTYHDQRSDIEKSDDPILKSQKRENKTQSPNTADNVEETQTHSNQDITVSNNPHLTQQKSTASQESDEISQKQHQESDIPQTVSDATVEEKQWSGQISSGISDTIHTDDLRFEDTGTYQIQNAGLIIAHPFIKHFLDNCALLDANQEIIDQELAVHALHYVATQKEQQLESDMLFEKMLCGVPIQQPIKRHIILSELIKEQSEELLQAIIKNWSILKNSSPDLLRSEFLQRPGLLSFKEDNPKITIERKTHDILLDKLPWGIGLCKLPWIEKLIFTDW